MEHVRLNRIFAAVVFAIAFVVYSATVAPTTSYWDCGEFITSSYILGVPHPPGAPLYILIGRIFSMIPFVKDIGLRVNMISVIVSAFSVMFGYLIIVRLLRAWRGVPESSEEKLIMYAGGIIGALGFAFSDSYWFNAVEAEVYAVSMFFTAIVVWLILLWIEKADEKTGDKILLLIAYLIGLATGVHLLNILAIPTLFLIIYFRKAELKLNSFLVWGVLAGLIFGAIYPGIVKGIPWVMEEFSFTALGLFALAIIAAIIYTAKGSNRVLNMFLMGLLLVSIGYSTYTALYIRSGLKPAINENHPDTPKKFVSYLNREQYGDIPIKERRAPFWKYQIEKMYIRYFGWQFIGHGTQIGPDNYVIETISLNGLLGLPFLIGLFGLYYHFKNDWKGASAVAMLFVMTGLAITIYLNQDDPQPRERDYAYVGSFFAFALWIGLGASFLLETALKSLKNPSLRTVGVGGVVGILVLAVPVNMLNFNFQNHDRSGNYVAYDYSYNILQSCEKDAILFTNGDNDTFPLWFLQYVYGIRRDIRVVNLSLLNTPWYIKQLRDEEPKVPINYSDEQIDRIQAQRWDKPRAIKIEVERDIVLRELNKSKDSSGLTPEEIPEKPHLAFDLYHSKVLQGQFPVLLVQDIMVMHILGTNGFKRPVYFAVTVASSNMLGLDNRRGGPKGKNYLRMDGLTFKVMPYYGPPDFISQEKIHKNLFETFQFRNLDNPKVFYNRNIQGLLQNYRSAFLRLASYYIENKLNNDAVAVLDRMEEVMPENVIPMRDFQLSLTIARMYADAGHKERFAERVDAALQNYYLDASAKVWTARLIAMQDGDLAKAESLALSGRKELLATNTLADQQVLAQTDMWLSSFYQKQKRYDDAADLLEEWVARNPTDRVAAAKLNELKRLVGREQTANDSGQTNGH